jgi:PAS domain S-box-containing protein
LACAKIVFFRVAFFHQLDMKKKTANPDKEREYSEALNSSEGKFSMLLELVGDAFFAGDRNGSIITANDRATVLTGYSKEELLGLNISDLFPNDSSLAESLGYDQTSGGTIVKANLDIFRKDGSAIPVELTITTVSSSTPDEEGQGIWIIIRDITERRQAEESLRKSEEKYRSIVECSPTAMYHYELDEDNQLILIDANPSSNNILGISHAPLIGMTLQEAFPNLSQTDIPEMYRKVALGETGPQSFEIPYQDDRFSGYYSVHVFRTGSHSITVDFSDITQRRRTEEALRRSEIEYRDTLNALPDWIYVVDEQFKIAMVNTSLKEVLIRNGLTPDCIGKEIGNAFPFINILTLDEIKLVFTSGAVMVFEQKFELFGNTLHTETTSVPIFKDGRVVKVILMIRDRSKEKEIEELKRRNTEQKEVLLREIHHRVKNNLAIVISMLNFQLRNNTSDELNQMIIDIQMRIRSMALIHEHLYRSDNLDRIPIATYIQSLGYIIMTTFSGHRINLVNNLEAMDVSIETALPIGLIINELLTNAFKYAFPGNAPGEVRVTLEKGEDQMCSLVVKDNGVGLPESSSMDSEKSLGLYIVRLLVEQLDGTVKIERNKGTAFHIRFLNLITERKQGLHKDD